MDAPGQCLPIIALQKFARLRRMVGVKHDIIPQNMKRNQELSRRRFVGGLLQGALVAAAAPNFIPLRTLAGENTPSKKVQHVH